MAGKQCTGNLRFPVVGEAPLLKSALDSLVSTHAALDLALCLGPFVTPGEKETYFTMLHLLSASLKSDIDTCTKRAS